ncbi:MAG: hypothetical protein KF744_01415 [Taibaiella sp.]|nr:hypothetical protein [Taibaiella sp.]
MLKSFKKLKPGTLAGLSGSIYILLVFPGYLHEAVATHNDAKWFCCVFSLVFAAANFVWIGVAALHQLDNTLTRQNPSSYAPSYAKPSRFSIYFSVATTLGFVLFMLPLGIRGLVKAIKTDNTLLIACSMFLITLAIWASIKHALAMKKGGIKGWVDENTRLRKV